MKCLYTFRFTTRLCGNFTLIPTVTQLRIDFRRINLRLAFTITELLMACAALKVRCITIFSTCGLLFINGLDTVSFSRNYSVFQLYLMLSVLVAVDFTTTTVCILAHIVCCITTFGTCSILLLYMSQVMSHNRYVCVRKLDLCFAIRITEILSAPLANIVLIISGFGLGRRYFRYLF